MINILNVYILNNFYLLLFILLTHYQSKFHFSVIMSIYNTGKYLDDSIGSLLNQSIDFNENIQIILVNDGSTDNSEEKCINYMNKYPKNIIYVAKKNEGLSSARNMGLEYAQGDIINFLDPDDLWSSNTFKEVSLFFRLYPNIDIIAGRLKFFEAINNYHPLDYKFTTSRVVDLNKEYNCIQLSAASSFIRRKAIGKKKFVKGLAPGEDALFLNKLLIKKPYYGVIKNALYLYRKRIDGTSIIQKIKMNDVFYFKSPIIYFQKILAISFKKFNKFLPFIQYLIAYEILFRIKICSYNYINLAKLIKYMQIILKLLALLDDKYILEQRNFGNILKIFALSKIHEKDMRKFITFKDGIFKYNENNIIQPANLISNLVLLFIDITDNFLMVEAKDNCWMNKDRYYYYCQIGEIVYLPEYNDLDSFSIMTMFGRILKGRYLKFRIPLNNKDILNKKIYFYFSYMNNTFEIFPNFGYFFHLPQINNSYFVKGNFILLYVSGRLTLKNNENQLRDKLEEKYCKELKKINKNDLITIRQKAIVYSKKLKLKEIWLINDRFNRARDNGEFFFRYLKKKNPKDIIFNFVISKNCSDYHRIKELGNVLSFGSKKYNNTFLKADKIITSTSNSWVDNPFGNDRKYLIDLYHFDLIFLQHGITKDDVSNYLNRFKKNYSIIITSSKYEYNFFSSSKFAYTNKNIKLTGFSRYDNLIVENTRNYKYNNILIIPTWRMNIQGTWKPITYEGIYSNNFNKTDFFLFYNSLMNSPKLLEAMKKYNYKGTFCLHPSLSEQWRDFKNNSIFSIMANYDYQSLMLKASLLITDYSSIFFDFAYMKKPVIYTQFDYERYRKNHYKKGYFDYILNGFGPVCHDLETCINIIIDELKGGCKMQNKYLKRVIKFFPFFDRYNNDRIYNAIKNSESFESYNLDKILKLIFILFFIKYLFYYYIFV